VEDDEGGKHAKAMRCLLHRAPTVARDHRNFNGGAIPINAKSPHTASAMPPQKYKTREKSVDPRADAAGLVAMCIDTER